MNKSHEFRDCVGPDGVLGAGTVWDNYLANVSGLARQVEGVLFPASTAEVQAVVRRANARRIPLYPVSGGANWGLGSRLPVRDGAVVVDLHRMNRILEVNASRHYVVIEPGVTQGQLYDHLQQQGAPLVLNVTGSGRSTSLIGNALDRGVGYFESRADALSGLEVVLGTGEILRTGYGHWADAKCTYAYRYGVGPDLGSLFPQANFGIVTQAGFRCLPRPEAHVSAVVKIDDPARFVPFFDALVHLRAQDVMRTIWHVGNRNRSEIALGPLLYDQLAQTGQGTPETWQAAARAMIHAEGFGPWNAVGGIMGTAGMVKTMCREITSALRGIAKVEFITDRKLRGAKNLLKLFSFVPGAGRKAMMVQAIEPLYGMSKGIPSDAALKSVCWPNGEMVAGALENPDHTHSGMLYVLPFIPLSGEVAKAVADQADHVFGTHGFKAFTTLNLVDAQSAEVVINLAFNRNNPDQSAAAHRAVDELTETYIQMGYPPYRLGIHQMARYTKPNNTYWQTVAELKSVFDPNHIIAPGRYNTL